MKTRLLCFIFYFPTKLSLTKKVFFAACKNVSSAQVNCC